MICCCHRFCGFCELWRPWTVRVALMGSVKGVPAVSLTTMAATQSNIFPMIVGEALWLIASGLIFALPLAYWGKRVAASLLRDIPRRNYLSLFFGTGIVVAVALLAPICARARHVWIPQKPCVTSNCPRLFPFLLGKTEYLDAN